MNPKKINNLTFKNLDFYILSPLRNFVLKIWDTCNNTKNIKINRGTFRTSRIPIPKWLPPHLLLRTSLDHWSFLVIKLVSVSIQNLHWLPFVANVSLKWDVCIGKYMWRITRVLLKHGNMENIMDMTKLWRQVQVVGNLNNFLNNLKWTHISGC